MNRIAGVFILTRFIKEEDVFPQRSLAQSFYSAGASTQRQLQLQRENGPPGPAGPAGLILLD